MSVHNVTRFIRASRKCWIQRVGSTNSVVSTVCSEPLIQFIIFPESAARRRFFAFTSCLILIFAFLPVYALDKPQCQNRKVDARVRVDHVIDGDTVVLADGEKLRLIGVDTPEIGYEGKPSQAGAVKARTFVQGLLKGRETVSLSYGAEKQDRYGRTLAHLFLQDGRNLQALLLAGGYATPLNMPPNVDFSDCYQRQANRAMAARLGIWRLSRYQAMPANTLTGKERGYHVIYGKISHTGNSSSSLWLNMDQHLSIRIMRDDLPYFPGLVAEDLPGRYLQVRGRLYRRHGQLILRVRHNNDLLLSDPASRTSAITNSR